MSSKAFIAALLVLVVAPIGVRAQSQADGTKDRPKKVRVFTDEDLARVRAKAEAERAVSESQTPADTDEAAASAPVATSEPSDTLDRARLREQETQRKDEEWERIRQDYQGRYDAAKAEIVRLRSAQAECQKNLTAYMMAYPATDDCSGYPGQIKAKEDELVQIEDRMADDARRRGVLPGKARIRR